MQQSRKRGIARACNVIIRRIPSPVVSRNQSIDQSMRPQTRTLAASGGSVLRAARTMIGLHTILAPVLSRLFSRYVDGISAETLRIGLLSRKLTLSNFTVNVDALDELALPCRVVRVRVDVLDLKYAVFGRDPLRATIEGVEIELESLDDSDSTDASVDFEDLLRRRDAREEMMEQIADAVVSSAWSAASESSWTLLAGVLERVGVEFRRAARIRPSPERFGE